MTGEVHPSQLLADASASACVRRDGAMDSDVAHAAAGVAQMVVLYRHSILNHKSIYILDTNLLASVLHPYYATFLCRGKSDVQRTE